MIFREREKHRYQTIKQDLFSPIACQSGIYSKNNRRFDFCLNVARENLHESLRQDAIDYFTARNITWHDGSVFDGKLLPSNHLCCSQSACVNSLWHLAVNPEFLAATFRPLYPELAEPLPMTADGLLPNGQAPYLSFEWVGTPPTSYLGERGRPMRGASATSADFAFRFRRTDGKIHLVLGEWKYTEFYSNQENKAVGHAGQARLLTYWPAFEKWQCRQPELPPYPNFFREPFYQLMRLTLLAQEMEDERVLGRGEMDADIVSVLLVVPEANREFTHNLKAFPALQQYGNTVGKAWSAIAPEDRFHSISTESLYATFAHTCPPPLANWLAYLLKRYAWEQPEAAV